MTNTTNWATVAVETRILRSLNTWDGVEERDERLDGAIANGREAREIAAERYSLPIDLVVEG